MPVGGSVGQTALNVTAGARTRWAAILSGVWMLVILVAFSGVVGKVAMPTLAAILIFAGFRRCGRRRSARSCAPGRTRRSRCSATFVATLLLPVSAAVGIGVVHLVAVAIEPGSGRPGRRPVWFRRQGRFVEQPRAERLAEPAVTVLDVYGSLFYAGSRTLQSRLPDPTGSDAPVVVLRLRGRTTLGSTFFSVVSGYADRLGESVGACTSPASIPHSSARLRKIDKDPLAGAARLYEATPIIGDVDDGRTRRRLDVDRRRRSYPPPDPD